MRAGRHRARAQVRGAATYFSSDEANPDTVRHFFADLQMYQLTHGRPIPSLHGALHLVADRGAGEQVDAGQYRRWRNEEYDRLWRAAEREMDPVKRAALFIRNE
jgi:peptide/nickel transport system substrate-binding protein